MKQYHINRDGVTLGTIPEQNILPLCVNGTVRATDLCWAEGMAEWRQVIEVFPPPQHPLPAMQQARREADDLGMRLLLPVGRSGWAIAAGYLGIFSVTLVLAPLALICGFLAIREIKQTQNTPNQKYGMGRAVFGLIMGLLGTLALFWWLGLLAYRWF